MSGTSIDSAPNKGAPQLSQQLADEAIAADKHSNVVVAVVAIFLQDFARERERVDEHQDHGLRQ